MNRPFKIVAVVLAFGAALFSARVAHAQKAAAGRQQVATAARVASANEGSPGALFVTVGGQEKKVADAAYKAWVIEGGRRVVYSGPDGAGGYENEGQSLHAYDAATGAQRKVMSEYYMIDKVTEVTTAAKKTALLVEMSDGGLGASYVAVVDPSRGEVFFRRWARVLSRSGDSVVLGQYKESDWEKLNSNSTGKVAPTKTERINLSSVLGGRVIVNKPSR
ncbi:MAG TPA: hypothetical protein VJ866_11120 [Pyrinomonadaceae bacterium]|nr:hypothetical protein [Pyrinomonadaceae bacterium]